MHQSRFSPSQSRYVFAYRAGKNRTRRSLTASIAFWARSSIRTNHWSDRYGSTGVFERSLCASGIIALFDVHQVPEVLHLFDDQLAGLVAVHPRVFAGVLVERAVGIEDVDHRQLVAAGRRRSRSDRGRA